MVGAAAPPAMSRRPSMGALASEGEEYSYRRGHLRTLALLCARRH